VTSRRRSGRPPSSKPSLHMLRRCTAGPSARVRLSAVLTSATCESACGKFPSMRLPCGRTPRRAARGRWSGDEPLEERPRVVRATEEHVGIGEPERAGEEDPSPSGRPSTCWFVTYRCTKPSFIRRRSTAATVPRRRGSSSGRKPTITIKEQARVELLRAVVLHEAVERRVEAVRADVGVDRVAGGAPALERPRHAPLLDRFDRAIEGEQHIIFEWTK